MKILDIPQSGKRGLYVSMPGRYGQVSRVRVVPSNPQTTAQLSIRGVFSTVTTAWRGLTEAQRLAWNAAAKSYRSKARCGQSGPLTGAQLYSKLNMTALEHDQDAIATPSNRPSFPALAPQNLVITNTAGVNALKLTCPIDPGDSTFFKAAAPVSDGQYATPPCVGCLAVPAPVAGASTITALYTTLHGVPPAGSKVFVQVYQVVDGHESIRQTFSAVVPTIPPTT